MLESLQPVIEKFSECEDWFDVAAHCYCFIQDVLDRNDLTEENYVSLYIAESEQSVHPNPNIPIQRLLVGQVFDMVSDTVGNPEGFRDASRQITSMLLGTTFEPFLDEEPNESTAIWSLLMAIDSAYAASAFINEQSRQRPLNRNAAELEIGVYFNCPFSVIGRHLSEKRIFPIPEDKLQNQLAALIFFAKRRNRPFPHVKRVPDSKASHAAKPALLKANELATPGEGPLPQEAPCLRIGSCSFTSIDLVDFDPSMPMEFVREEGVAFALRYHEGADSYYDSVVEPALRAAIDHGCQILLFPEMVFAQSFHKRLAESLKDISGKGSLRLVVAGSTWDEERKCNYSTFYDCYGNDLGSYFKKQPYVRKSSKGNLTEHLSAQDEPDILADVPGIGRVMAAICKDVVSVGSESFEIANMMNPDLICIPAFSSSVTGGFELPLKMLAQRNLAISCMANYCAARNDPNKPSLGYVCAPGYVLTDPPMHHAEPVLDSMNKDSCIGICGEDGKMSCIDIIDIDYALDTDSSCSPKIEVEKIRF